MYRNKKPNGLFLFLEWNVLCKLKFGSITGKWNLDVVSMFSIFSIH